MTYFNTIGCSTELDLGRFVQFCSDGMLLWLCLASVHMPRIGHNTPGFNWYGTERLIHKHLSSRGIPAYVYLWVYLLYKCCIKTTSFYSFVLYCIFSIIAFITWCICKHAYLSYLIFLFWWIVLSYKSFYYFYIPTICFHHCRAVESCWTLHRTIQHSLSLDSWTSFLQGAYNSPLRWIQCAAWTLISFDTHMTIVSTWTHFPLCL